MLTTIFTKLPEPGLVKTRLCPPLSPEAAASLAEAMLLDVVRELDDEGGEGGDAGVGRLNLSIAPGGGSSSAEREGWFRSRFPELELLVQRGEGLGARLAQHFTGQLEAGGHTSAVVVGSDVPELRREHVSRAHAWLHEGADVVFGPDESGGYYLVGMSTARPELFTRVAMSTPDMLQRTLELARELDLAVRVLPVVGDVDTATDLERLCAEPGRLPPHTRESLQRLEML